MGPEEELKKDFNEGCSFLENSKDKRAYDCFNGILEPILKKAINLLFDFLKNNELHFKKELKALEKEYKVIAENKDPNHHLWDLGRLIKLWGKADLTTNWGNLCLKKDISLSLTTIEDINLIDDIYAPYNAWKHSHVYPPDLLIKINKLKNFLTYLLKGLEILNDDAQYKIKYMIPESIQKDLAKYVQPIYCDQTTIPEYINDLIKDKKNVCVVGESGFGKTTLLSYVFNEFYNNNVSFIHYINRQHGSAQYETISILTKLRKFIENNVDNTVSHEQNNGVSEELEFIKKLLLRWGSQTNGNNYLTVFIDGLDENCYDTEDPHQSLLINLQDILDCDYKIIWIFSTQPRQGQDLKYFEIVKLPGLPSEQAKEIVRSFFFSRKENEISWIQSEFLKIAKTENESYDPETLKQGCQGLIKRLPDNILPFDIKSLRDFFDGIVFYRDKYKWIIQHYIEPNRSGDLPELKAISENWRHRALPASVPSFHSFLKDILAILSVSRIPVPFDILQRLLSIEDTNTVDDNEWDSALAQKFKFYPQSLVIEYGFLEQALLVLQPVVHGFEISKHYAFAKSALKDAFISLVDEKLLDFTKNRFQSLGAQWVKACMKTNALVKSADPYIMTELIYLLSLSPQAGLLTLEDLFIKSGVFPEWLQQYATMHTDEQWIPKFQKDLLLLNKENAPGANVYEFMYHLNKALNTFFKQLQYYKSAIPELLRDEVHLNTFFNKKKPVTLISPDDSYNYEQDNESITPIGASILGENYIAIINSLLYNELAIFNTVSHNFTVYHFANACLAFIKVGGCLITGHPNGVIILTDLQISEQKKFITNDETSIAYFLQLSDEEFVSFDFSGKISIWNITSSKSLKTLQGHKAPITSRILLTSNVIAIGYADGLIQLLDINCDSFTSFAGHSTSITSLNKLSEDLLVSFDGYFIRIWDVKNKKQTQRIEPDQYPDTVFGGIAEDQEKIYVENFAKAMLEQNTHVTKPNIITLGRNHFACLSAWGFVYLFQKNDSNGLFLFFKILDIVALEIEKISECLFVLKYRNTITGQFMFSVWDIDGNNTATLPYADENLYTGIVSFSQGRSNLFFFYSASGKLQLFDLDKKVSLDLSLETMSSLPILKNNKIFFSTTYSNIIIYDIETHQKQKISNQLTTQGPLSSIVVAKDFIVTGGCGNPVSFFDKRTGAILKRFGVTSSLRQLINFGDNGCIWADGKGQIYIFKDYTDEPQTIMTNVPEPTRLELLSNRYAVIGFFDGRIQVWDIYKKILKKDFMSISYDFYKAFDDKNLEEIYGQEIAETINIENNLRNHQISIYNFFPSFLSTPSGLLIIPMPDGSILILNSEDNTEVRLLGHDNAVLSLFILPDGNLVSGDTAGQIRYWDMHNKNSHILGIYPGIGPCEFQYFNENKLWIYRKGSSPKIWDLNKDTFNEIYLEDITPFDRILPKEDSFLVYLHHKSAYEIRSYEKPDHDFVCFISKDYAILNEAKNQLIAFNAHNFTVYNLPIGRDSSDTP